MQLSYKEQIELDKNILISNDRVKKKQELLTFTKKLTEFVGKYLVPFYILTAITVIIGFFNDDNIFFLILGFFMPLLAFISLIVLFFIQKTKKKELEKTQNELVQSYNNIENITAPYLVSYINNKIIVDKKSVETDGFNIIPEPLLQAMLDVYSKNKLFEKIYLPQNSITLYKSLNPNPENSDIVSTNLVID